MKKKWPGAEQFVPATRSLRTLRDAAQGCRGCDLYEQATQTVFGDGRARAKLMIVGETPGDIEDREGKTFVGPAGKLLMQIFEELGVSRSDFYLTNAVKHFKFVLEPRGKRRIHSRPLQSEITACRPWLEAEIALVRPSVILCLGAVAAQTLMGAKFSVARERGKRFEAASGASLLASYHPAAVLRAPDPETRAALRAELRGDVAKALRLARRPPS